MFRTRFTLAVAGAITLSSTFTLALAGPAAAVDNPNDPTITAVVGDLVGVGSDTSQVAVHYLADGHGTDVGYNADKSTGRIVSFAADGTPATISLRGGAAITRPNGSGAGKALLYGSSNNTDVTFARSSSTLSPTEISNNLLQSPFAVDGLKFAVNAAGSNAPAAVSIADAVKIYKGEITTWNQIPGNEAGSNATITPLIPQSGSGTLKFFESQLKAANSGVAVVYGGNVSTTQEHSDIDINGKPNAIAPFSTGRAKSTPTVLTIGGFSANRALYNAVRAAGVDDTAISAAFGEAGFLCGPNAKPLIEAAGFDQLADTARGGECGTFGTTNVTNFKTSSEADAQKPTTTELTALAINGNKLRLTANVSSSSSTPVGSVEFYEGATKVATVDTTDGQSILTLSNVAVGSHSYTAKFVPTDPALFVTSSSAAVAANMLTESLVTLSITPLNRTFGGARMATVHATVDREPATGPIAFKLDSGAPVNVVLDDGAASFIVPANTAVGTHDVKATLPGSSSVFSTSATKTLTVTKAVTTSRLALNVKSIPSTKRAKATVSIAITGASSTVKASGKVTIKSGTKTIATGTLVGGKVVITLPKLQKGKTYSLKASFAGNSNYGSSTSLVVKLTVT